MTIKVGLIGAGNIAEEHLKTIAAHPDCCAAGICSRTKSRAASLARKYNVPHVSDTISGLLADAEPDALMVMVSVENMYDVGMEVLDTALPVFFEKPAGLWPEQAEKLVAKAQKVVARTMVGFNRRHFSVFHEGLRVVREHGPLLGVLVEGHERIGEVHECERFSQEAISGWIYANATHTIDLLRFFGGEIETIHTTAASHQEPTGDQFSATMRFASGAVGTYISHWLSPGGWRVVLYGEGVTVEFKPLEKGVWTDCKYQTHEINPPQVDQDFKPGFFAQLSAFAGLVNNGTLEAPSMDLAEALKTMKTAETICSGVSFIKH